MMKYFHFLLKLYKKRFQLGTTTTTTTTTTTINIILKSLITLDYIIVTKEKRKRQY